MSAALDPPTTTLPPPRASACPRPGAAPQPLSEETAAQCAVRESLEETGLDITLVPGPTAPVPARFPHRVMPAPWLVAETPASPDRHTGEPHLHADHIYVASTASLRPAATAEHQVRWFTPADISSVPGISEDSRLLAAELLAAAASQSLRQSGRWWTR